MSNVQHCPLQKTNHAILLKMDRSALCPSLCCMEPLRGKMKRSLGKGSPVERHISFSPNKSNVAVALRPL